MALHHQWGMEGNAQKSGGASEEAFLAAARAYGEETLGLEDARWHIVEEGIESAYAEAWTRTEDGLWVTLSVGKGDGRVHGVLMESGLE